MLPSVQGIRLRSLHLCCRFRMGTLRSLSRTRPQLHEDLIARASGFWDSLSSHSQRPRERGETGHTVLEDSVLRTRNSRSIVDPLFTEFVISCVYVAPLFAGAARTLPLGTTSLSRCARLDFVPNRDHVVKPCPMD